MAEQLVIKSIQNSNQTYRIGPAELLKLQNAGVSQRIIEALLETNKRPEAANAPPALAATPAAPAPAAAPQQPEQAPLTAEERKALAQKYSACQQQATRDHPGGGTELVNAYLVCNQMLQRK
jgi:hypothetical protein